MLIRMLYQILKYLVGISFNLLNIILAGNLPPLGCIIVIVEEQGRFLLIQRPKGKLAFPGGFIRWREEAMAAAQRECEEETGLRIHIDTRDVVGYYSQIGQHFNTLSTLTIVYRGKVIGGELRTSIEGQPCWLSESEMYSNLEKRSESLLPDYFHFRSLHSTLQGTSTITQEITNEAK